MSQLKPAPFSHSANFPRLLEELGCSVLVSTYQAGQVAAFGGRNGQLLAALEPFSLAMGMALHPQKIAVGCRGMIWFLENAGAEVAQRVTPSGTYDAAWLARTAHVTGNIRAHEMAFVGNQLWVVNTLFSCLATIEPGFSFVPQWKPAFISNCHVPGDRCHLNGLALEKGRPKYVTAMAETDEPNGWRVNKETSGVLIDIDSHEVVCRGLAMPHSPRVYQGKVWAHDSGRGQLVVIDPNTGTWETVAALPGYTRGLAFCNNYALVGLSRIRETAVFGGVPIAQRPEELKCGVAVVDLRSGQMAAAFYFAAGIEEIFDIQVSPGVGYPLIRGPLPKDDQTEEIWIAPPPVTQPTGERRAVSFA
jgi:uncharacterized protein (TIGR03032 family)